MREPNRRGSLTTVLSRHWLITVLFVMGAALRVAASIADRPALVYNGDSFSYLRAAQSMQPATFHPLGYSAFLRLITWGHLWPVPVVQHLLGLAVALGVYVALLRLRVRPVIAAVGAAPLLLDVGLLTLEQYVLAETLFIALLFVAIGTVVWPRARRPGVLACAGAGLALAAAVLTRTTGAVVVIPLVVLLALRRWGWLRLVALLAAAVLPLVAYAGWYDARWGTGYALSGSDGRLLYAQVATFTNCSGLNIPADERALCPDPRHRLTNSEYAWSADSPIASYRPPPGRDLGAVLRDFDRRVIFGRPTTWLRVTGEEFVRFFRPTRTSALPSETEWRFENPLKINTSLAPATVDATLAPGVPRSKRPHAPVGWLSAYSVAGFVPGPLVAAALLGALFVGFRRRIEPDGNRRSAAGVLAGSGLLMVLLTAATAPVNFRYLLPIVALAGPAGAIALDTGVRALTRRRERDRPHRDRPDVAVASSGT